MTAAADIKRLLEEQNALLREIARNTRPRVRGVSKKTQPEKRSPVVQPSDIDRARAARQARRLGLK